jgi:hypothetical protein
MVKLVLAAVVVVVRQVLIRELPLLVAVVSAY